MFDKIKIDYIFAGLGNPGSQYASTRHNIGWMVIDALYKKYKADPKTISKIAEYAVININGKKVLAVKPLTFMNDSGRAVKRFSIEYGVKPEKIVAIMDEYNFPTGKMHIKSGGTSGGHNGTASIMQELGRDDFIRLRCGIGKDFPPGGMVDYVLGEFPASQYEEINKFCIQTIEALECLIRDGIAKASSQINSGRLWAPSPPKKDKPELVKTNNEQI